jgi:L-arabonate dehydrase
VWQLHESLKAGEIDLHQFLSAEGGMSRSAGTCNTMGTASTMACMAEALGTSLPHNAAIPAVDARRYVLAQMSGMRAVQMARDGLTLSKILVREAPSLDDEVIRPLDNPLIADGGIRILRGNLSPRGAVLKPSAATPALLKHRGRAVVFENLEHYKERIVDEDLDIDASCVMVLKNCGPKGYPGMAEVGNMGLPPKLLRRGIKDMVRISDARMSGTAYGTVVLHVAPEAADGGPLAAVRDGDWIELDCDAGRLHLDISDEELAARLASLSATDAQPMSTRGGGYQKLYVNHVLQADEGCDFDFLVGCRGSAVPRHSH